MGITVENNDLYREERLHRPPSYTTSTCRRCSTSQSILAPFKKMKGLKNIGKRMGFGSSSHSSSTRRVPSNLLNQPVRFNTTHGENITLNKERTIARRRDSFCKGLTFSDRPIRVDERVHVKLAELSDNWSGVIRFGFTSHNPASLKGQLPKYACPDLTNRKGFWAKAVNERHYANKDIVMYFYVSKNGNVYYGVEGKPKELFFPGVDTSGPLWIMIDVYGNSTAVEFVNVQLNNSLTADQEAGFGLNSISRRSSASLDISLVSDFNRLALISRSEERLSSARATPNSYVDSSVSFISDAVNESMDKMKNLRRPAETRRIPHNLILTPLQFHEKHGLNIRLSNDKFIATRSENEFTRGYVFSPRTIGANEFVVVQILKTESRYMGGLTFGMTPKNPATVDPFTLPEDPDDLLDGRDSFYVHKNVANSPNVGDILIFSLNEEGEVRMKKNGESQMSVFYVEKNLPYWWFFDLYGSTIGIRAYSGVAERPTCDTMLSNIHQSPSTTVSSGPRVSMHSPPATHFNAPVEKEAAVSISQPAVFSNMPVLVLNCAITGSRSSFEPIQIVIQNQSDGRTSQLMATSPQQDSSQVVVRSSDCYPAVNGNYVNVAQTTPREKVDCSSDNGKNREYQLQEWAKSNWRSPVNSPTQSECIVCYEKPVDCVLYRCGHMCLCYDCARELWRGRGDGHCPFCRAVIRDVVRTYKP